MIDKTNNDVPYLIGRATSRIETITGFNVPKSFAAIVAVNPLQKLSYWMNEALKTGDAELIDIASRIDNLPAYLNDVETGQYYVGYYHQNNADMDVREQLIINK